MTIVVRYSRFAKYDVINVGEPNTAGSCRHVFSHRQPKLDIGPLVLCRDAATNGFTVEPPWLVVCSMVCPNNNSELWERGTLEIIRRDYVVTPDAPCSTLHQRLRKWRT